jgi:hypothetical protein
MIVGWAAFHIWTRLPHRWDDSWLWWTLLPHAGYYAYDEGDKA